MKYELTVVLPGKTTPAKKKSIGKSLDDLIKINKGKVLNTSDWGEKELAYEIAKNQTGVFLHYELELNTDVAKNLSDKLRMENEIIRSLLVRVKQKKKGK